jgi:hypothetical protein
MSIQKIIGEYWNELIASDSEDTFRYLVELSDGESVSKFAISRYKESESNSEKNIALEVLKEIRNSFSECAIQEIALNAQSLEEWKDAIEARIYSNEKTAVDFLKKEQMRYESEGNKGMVAECERLIVELTP